MRITQKGQVTIPEELRQKYGFLPYTEITFVEERGRVYLKALVAKKRGVSIVKRLRGTASVRMTTDEIMNLTRGKK